MRTGRLSSPSAGPWTSRICRGSRRFPAAVRSFFEHRASTRNWPLVPAHVGSDGGAARARRRFERYGKVRATQTKSPDHRGNAVGTRLVVDCLSWPGSDAARARSTRRPSLVLIELRRASRRRRATLAWSRDSPLVGEQGLDALPRRRPATRARRRAFEPSTSCATRCTSTRRDGVERGEDFVRLDCLALEHLAPEPDQDQSLRVPSSRTEHPSRVLRLVELVRARLVDDELDFVPDGRHGLVDAVDLEPASRRRAESV